MMAPAALRLACAAALQHKNVQAFLRVIREGESSQDGAAYRMQVGGRLLDSLEFHPRQVVTVAIRGKEVRSSAAGAYQFLQRTWDGCAAALGLTDFSAESQDLAAVYLIRGRGALDDVLAGRLDAAVRKCAAEWASLPGDVYGQGGISMDRARAVWRQWGGSETPTRQEPAGATIAPAPIPEPQPAPAAAPAPITWPFERPKESPVVAPIVALAGKSLLSGLAGTLIDIFSPLAREKVTKEIARHTTPEVADQVSTAIIEAAKTATGRSDPVQAVAAVREAAAAGAGEPLVRPIEASALDTLDRLAPLLDKVHQWQMAGRAADESSMDAAARRAVTLAGDRMFLRFGSVLQLTFIEALSLILLAISAGGALWLGLAGKLNDQLLGAIVTLMLIAGYTGVREFWLGSSRGSDSKQMVLDELARRGKS